MARGGYHQRRKRIHFAIASTVATCVLATFYVMPHHDKSRVAPISSASITSNPQNLPAAKPAATNRGLPAQLVIPKLNINTKVIYVGVTKDGNMEAPKNVHDVGWYKYGAIPGNKGAAVIAGHLDGLKGEPGVFSELEKLQKGDSFSVIDDKDRAMPFVVRELREYGQNEQPAEVFSAAEGAHLNLITCTGAWDKDARRFTHRLVVFADRSP